ncbi:MAG: hypothetical protein COV59_02110 [Candidatus Magasanikbacteria bacterium CG11_big_fil_rev_8_21_14_0_20_39_34]|uniref:Type I restriction enzyme R protein N-terminal domain-containing protein n=1 Tax=Candidatus Magasanikbacteria bacterium CG11_big_fil_rev_8_21_14_0_20_39_34 TaxID=1974653 RepID=A0A2H0N764_9BACT|nr:MAG: hypothetical protein COV59_02110 [Candidatus Magasanikbacteria bacterium CG11_big_fil_rev_8_21_14_0_20_39_34]
MAKKFTSEYSLRHELIKILLERGYPEESLNLEWRKGTVIYDLAIVDPKSGELIAIFEFKLEHKFIFTTERLRKKLSKFATLDITTPVPLYIVSATDGGEEFSISKVLYQSKDLSVPEFVQVKELPDFETLKSKVIAGKKKVYRDWFRIKSTVIGWLLLILFILDWSSITSITNERLLLLGIIIGLFLAPDVYRLKILGFEIERHK